MSSTPLETSLDPESYERHRRGLELATDLLLANLSPNTGSRETDAREVGCYARIVLAMMYDFDQALVKLERRRPADQQRYQLHRRTSDAGQTLEALVWARGRITHSDSVFYQMGWLESKPVFLDSSGQLRALDVNVLTAEGLKRTKIMTASWVWSDASEIEASSRRPDGDEKRKRSWYQQHVAAKSLVASLQTARTYLMSGEWNRQAG